MLPDALQEVSQLSHGRVPDLCPQFGDVFRHDGAEPVFTSPGKTRLLQLLQRPQRWVVPDTHMHKCKNTKQFKKKKEKVFIQSYTQLISFELILKQIWFSFVRAKLCSFADADYNFLDKGGKICKTNRHAAIKQCPGCQMHD